MLTWMWPFLQNIHKTHLTFGQSFRLHRYKQHNGLWHVVFFVLVLAKQTLSRLLFYFYHHLVLLASNAIHRYKFQVGYLILQFNFPCHMLLKCWHAKVKGLREKIFVVESFGQLSDAASKCYKGKKHSLKITTILIQYFFGAKMANQIWPEQTRFWKQQWKKQTHHHGQSIFIWRDVVICC